MQFYLTAQARRKRPIPNQISPDYWRAFNRLYGCNRSEKTSVARTAKIDDLNAEKLQKALP